MPKVSQKIVNSKYNSPSHSIIASCIFVNFSTNLNILRLAHIFR